MILFELNKKKKPGRKNPKVANTNKGRIMLLSKCVVRDSKKQDY